MVHGGVLMPKERMSISTLPSITLGIIFRGMITRGLGQGLFVARTVAEAHGGFISVTSHPGHGSIFSMVLPAA